MSDADAAKEAAARLEISRYGNPLTWRDRYPWSDSWVHLGPEPATIVAIEAQNDSLAQVQFAWAFYSAPDAIVEVGSRFMPHGAGLRAIDHGRVRCVRAGFVGACFPGGAAPGSPHRLRVSGIVTFQARDGTHVRPVTWSFETP